MQKIKMIPASELVIDFDIYPRYTVDGTHISYIEDAIRAGVELPPIIVCAKTKRIVDGVHRVRGYQRALDRNADIPCLLKKYESEAEMILDSARLNASHGRKLSNFDRIRLVGIAHQHGVKLETLAEVLNMPGKKLRSLTETRSAKDGPRALPLKRTISHMVGKRLSKRQREANQRLGGMRAVFYVNQIVELLEADLIDKSDESLLLRLGHLAELLETWQERVAA